MSSPGQERNLRVARRGLRPDAPSEFLIADNPADCRECWGCVRHCPSKALSVIDRRTHVIPDRCVKCGQCVSECPRGGHTVRDDLPKVRELLASGRPVVAVLATEFVAAMHPMTPAEAEAALEAVGFYAVESTLLGEEIVAAQYERSHAQPCISITLRSTCPVTVEWVRRFYPSLVPALTPIVPPYIAQARLVRMLYPDDCAIVYVSPCFARKDEIYHEGVSDAIDVAIDFSELKRLIEGLPVRPPHRPVGDCGSHRPEPIKELSLTDGFPRRTIASHDHTDTSVVTVRGLRSLDRLLDAIVHGEAAPAVVDMLNCEGCIDGPAVAPGVSVFAKRNLAAAERDRRARPAVRTRELLAHLPPVDVVRSFRAEPVLFRLPSAEEIDAVLAQGDFSSRDALLDCGACGHDTCVEHATAIYRGTSSWDMCFPLQRTRLDQANEQLERCATIDPVTGFSTRPAFEKRCAEEIARARRYGGRLSMLRIAVDGVSGDVSDDRSPVHDAAMRRIASLLKQHLRTTDIVGVYGRTEWGVLLPGVAKTAALAVSEKIRAHIHELSDFIGADTGQAVLSVSIGISGADSTDSDAGAMIASATEVMQRARGAGGDKVMIAAG